MAKSEHTCGPRKPGELIAQWGLRNKKCPGCREESEAISDLPSEPPGEVSTPGSVEVKAPPLELDAPKGFKVMDVLDVIQKMGGARWSRKGKKFGKRIRKKGNCVFGHTCEALPFGVKKSDVFDKVTGDVNPDYLDWYLKFMRCQVCSGKIEGCDETVKTEFGKPKPYCQYHIEHSSEYVKDLMGKVERGEIPEDDLEDDSQDERLFQRSVSHLLRVGDKVKKGNPGFKHRVLTGRIIGISDEMDVRTHVVKWENPKVPSLEITYEDPKDLELTE